MVIKILGNTLLEEAQIHSNSVTNELQIMNKYSPWVLEIKDLLMMNRYEINISLVFAITCSFSTSKRFSELTDVLTTIVTA